MMIKKMRFTTCIMILLCLIVSCKQKKDAESTGQVPADVIYIDYQVRGNEGNDSVTILANFREFDEFGYALKLDTPAMVQLDDELIQGTTLKIPGTFYEVQKKLDDFSGTHKLRFTDANKKVYEEAFTYQPMVLTSALPDIVTDSVLILELQGLDSNDMVHVVLTDTAYASEGIERIDTVKNNRIIITAKELAGLANGPIQLELQREMVRPVMDRRILRGKLSIMYSLRREFTLSRRPD